MTYEEVKAIVANPYVSPEDLVKHYLSNPLYLEEWLRAKGKALAGVSIDCTQCVMSTYISEKLTAEGFEVQLVEVTNRMAEVDIMDCDIDVKLPEWVQRYVKALDMHRNPDYPYSKNRKAKIFSGNLAANILKISLQENPV